MCAKKIPRKIAPTGNITGKDRSQKESDNSPSPAPTTQEHGHQAIKDIRNRKSVKEKTRANQKVQELDAIELSKKRKPTAAVTQQPVGSISKAFPAEFKPYLDESFLGSFHVPKGLKNDQIRRAIVLRLHKQKHDLIIDDLRYRQDTMDIVHFFQNQAWEYQIITTPEQLAQEFRKYIRFGNLILHKHAALASGRMLSNFIYLVMPAAMIEAFGPGVPIPKHVGVFKIVPTKEGYDFVVVKAAPPLHANYVGATAYLLIAKQLADKMELIYGNPKTKKRPAHKKST